LSKTSDHLELTIQDDGIGFNTAKNNGGIGLRNIKNRVEYYNGTVRIDSEPGKGCAVTIVIPLQSQARITG
jgi:signal transduction histidine kinase